jgi:hypothetical protein
MSPLTVDLAYDSWMMRKASATQMAEASYMSQEATKKNADNMSRMLWLQEKDLKVQKNEADDMRAERKEEFHQQLDERKAQTELIKKMVDKMMPDEDPTEKLISREHKLNEVHDVEDLYQFKINQ